MFDLSEPRPFKVKYRGTERSLTRQQLERAPESVLSIALLRQEYAAGSDALEIPYSGTASAFGVWQDGTADLFQVL